MAWNIVVVIATARLRYSLRHILFDIVITLLYNVSTVSCSLNSEPTFAYTNTNVKIPICEDIRDQNAGDLH